MSVPSTCVKHKEQSGKWMKTMLKTTYQDPTRCSQTLIGTSTPQIGAKVEQNHVRKADLRENKDERIRKSNDSLTSNMGTTMKPREMTRHGTWN